MVQGVTKQNDKAPNCAAWTTESLQGWVSKAKQTKSITVHLLAFTCLKLWSCLSKLKLPTLYPVSSLILGVSGPDFFHNPAFQLCSFSSSWLLHHRAGRKAILYPLHVISIGSSHHHRCDPPTLLLLPQVSPQSKPRSSALTRLR